MKQLIYQFKYLFLVVTVISLHLGVKAQNFGGCGTEEFEENNFSEYLGCAYTSDSWTEKYRTPGYWIPDANTPIKTIQVNWIICRDDNGQYGWQDTQEFRDQVDLMFTHINEWYSNSQPKGYSLTCEPTYTHVYDTRIRFELNEIYFLDNTTFNQACNITDANFIISYLHTNYPETKKLLYSYL